MTTASLSPFRLSTAYCLYAPESYTRATPEVRATVVNGCGPGGWKLDLVPDTIWFLDISLCCDIHDWMYVEGETIEAKEEADRVFLNNMLRAIDAAGGPKILQALRRHRAAKYYNMVHLFGGPAYWLGKNSSTQLIAATSTS